MREGESEDVKLEEKKGSGIFFFIIFFSTPTKVRMCIEIIDEIIVGDEKFK